MSTTIQSAITSNTQGEAHPAQKKLRKINKPKKSNEKTLWLVGHSITLFFSILYMMYYVQRKSKTHLVPWLAYKFALMGVWLSYTISLNTQYNLKSLPHYGSLIATENFQYLLLSVVWFFNRSSLFKILPYTILSILHISNNFKLNAVLKQEKLFAYIILYNELFLFPVLFVDTILLKGTSGYGLVIYTMFVWLRILQNENARFFLYDNVTKLDVLMMKIKNEKVKKVWLKIKKFLTYKQARFQQKFL
ncbi:hypothetical protein DAPK24_021440 [Pichia kluyveri]|uniref:Derlin n=1 Tax=Pichia kluyveri TaxID=36015 RepID=A0AAV5R2B6_PICKL|nr:hypothetical protein DAPK24_021440 [Pichia kluyveri]